MVIFIVLFCIAIGLWKTSQIKSENFLIKTTAPISRIEINNVSNNLVFTRSDTSWLIEKPFQYRANEININEIIEKIQKTKLSHPLSSNTEIYDVFGLNESSATKVSIYSGNTQKPFIEFSVGKEGTEMDSCYLKFAGTNEVFQASGLSPYDFTKSIDEYLDRTIIAIEEQKIESIEIKGKKKSFKISKSSANWFSDNVPLNENKTLSLVNPMLNTLKKLEAEKVIQNKDLTEKLNMEFTVTIKLKEEPSLELAFYRGKDKDNYYLKTSKEKNFTFSLPEWKISAFKK